MQGMPILGWTVRMGDVSKEMVWIRADLCVSKNPVAELLKDIRKTYGEEESKRKISYLIEHIETIMNETDSYSEGLKNVRN